MSVTAEEIFKRAMALAGYTEPDGSVSGCDSTDIWRCRAPALLDMGQRELSYYLSLILTRCYDFSDSGSYAEEDGIKYCSLPENFISAVRITDGTGEFSPEAVLRPDDRTICVPSGFCSTLYLSYNASPYPISTMASVFSYPDNDILATLPFYLASRCLREENTALANELEGVYEDNRIRLKAQRSVTGEEPIADVYGGLGSDLFEF